MKKSIILIFTLLFLLLFINCILPPEEEIAEKPEISIVDDSGSTIFPTTGSYEFDDTEIDSSTEVTFVIKNTGDGELTLTGSPLVDVSGTDASEFEVSLPSTNKISAPGQASFKITFTPETTGDKTATVTITNNDENKSFYTFTITGTAISKEATGPEINILAGSTSIVSSGSHDVGSAQTSTTTNSTTFTIQNLGSSTLSLSGSPIVAISGTNSSDFTVTQPSSSSVAASSEVTFNIVFNPSSTGSRTATVTISNDDSDEGTYTFTLTGTGTATAEPEINILAGSTSIASSGSHDVGSAQTSTTTNSTTFTIQNLGSSTLNLSGSPIVAISGTNSSDFTVTQPSSSSVAASSEVTFTIVFNPSSTGSRTATVTISNDDSDEGTYSFTLTGTGTTTSEPEINILAGSTSIASSGSHDVGSAQSGTTTNSTTFTIQNLGTSTLNLSGSPIVAISGTNSSDFTVTQPSSSSVAASSEVTFTIVFNPSSTGSRTATVTISNDDSDEGTYTFTLTGTGTTTSEPEIDIQVSSLSISSSGTQSFSTLELGSTETLTFTILNTGSGNLELSGSPIVALSGADSTLFTVTQPSVSTISAGGNTTFTIEYAPTTSSGSKTATITINNNDSNEGTYTINLNANAILTASKIIIEGDSSTVNNGSTINLTVTAKNENDITVTDFTGDVSLSADSGINLSPNTISISSLGTATESVTVSSSSTIYNDTSSTFTATSSGLSDGSVTITVQPVFTGTELTASDFTSAKTILSGTQYLAPREPTDSAITVGGHITVGAGAKLVIYQGNTLDMQSYYITVNGILEIYGVDNKRVRIKSSSNNWQGIWVGTQSGTSDGKLYMDGAYLDGLVSSPVNFGYSSGGTFRANSSTIKNSRLEVPSSTTREVIDFMYPKNGATYNIENNILVSGYENPVYISSNSDGSITLNFLYNTIIGKTSGSNNIALDIREDNGSTFDISHNIITGKISDGVYSYNSTNNISMTNNIFNISGTYNGGTATYSLTENVEYSSTLTITWVDSEIFENYNNDYRLKQTGDFPAISQVNNYSSMVGSLSNDSVNQKGAYGNGGTPPLPSEN